MLKKLTLLAFALAALTAFAVPSIASAAALEEGGVPLEVGAEFTATSTNTTTVTGAGTLDCAKITLHMEVTNEAATKAASLPGGVTTENCVVTKEGGSKPVVITTANAQVSITGGGKGTASLTFVSDIPEVPIPCHFATAEGTPAGITYTGGGSSIGLSGSVGGPCGPGTITGTFSLETSDQTPITISN